MPDTENSLPPVPEAKVLSAKHSRFSFVWLVPLVAALAGVWIAVTTIHGEGPKITIVFRSADGLEANKTKIRYNGVEVGTIGTLRLSDDHQHVIATAKMNPKTESLLVKDTAFWVVRPQISGASVSGLSTLISGAYLGMEIGKSSVSARDFVALEDAPMEVGGIRGRFYTLKATELGSVSKGTPLYFRHLQAGQVVDYKLDASGQFLRVKVFIQEPYDRYVTPGTRFWQASGVDVSLSASGLKVETESLLSIVVGGIAFEPPATGPAHSAADENATFTLFKDRTEAFLPPAANPQTYTVVFKQSVRGLAVGAPVEFNGIPIGEVTEMHAQFDAATYEFSVPVTVQIDPARFGVKFIGVADSGDAVAAHRKLMDTLVARGLRAQLRTGSLISGSLYVAIDVFPDAPVASLDWTTTPVEFPALPGTKESLEASVTGILNKLNQVPFKQLGDELHTTLADLDKTLVGAQSTLTNADAVLANAGKLIAPNSALEAQLNSTLQEVGGAARALRLLADYLERHPEALLRGKSGEAQ